MAVDALKVQVLFSAIDRLTGPLKGMKGGAKGLKADIAATKKELLGLERAQGKAGGFRKAETDYRQLGAALDVARAEAKAARLELGAAEKPTAALAKAAERAAAAERKAGAAYEAQGRKLQGLGNELEAAGVDASRLVEHEDRLALKIYETNKRIAQQTTALERNAKAQARAEKVANAGRAISGAGMGLSLGVTLPALALAKSSSEAANESKAAIAQVEASLASMGPKAGRTLEQLRAGAEKLQATSLFDDDDILVKSTANLLTFGNVGGKVFDRAQQAAIDMSAKMGGDLQGSTMMLGKALNDPAKGISKLTKAGVSFSAEQVEMIKKLDKGGQRAKAQALMLAELEKQFGGSALAQRKASPTAESAEQWRNFQENVGGVVNVLLPKLNAMLSRALGWFNGLSPEMQTTVVTAAALAAALGPVLIVVGKLITGVAMMRKAWLAMRAAQAVSAAAGAASMGPLLIVVAIAAAIGVAAYLIYKHWDKIKAAFASAWQWIGAKAQQLGALFMRFPLIFGPLGVAVAFVVRNWSAIKGAFAAGVSFIATLPSRMATIGRQIIQGLIGGVTGRLAALKSTIVNAASAVANWFKSKLGIHSPSRVFMGFGGNITEGLSRGIGAGEGSAVRRVGALSSRVAGAFAAGSLVASPALASSRAPGATSSASSGTAGLTIGSVTIQLSQQPGEDGAALARRLADELAKLGASSRRGSFEDD